MSIDKLQAFSDFLKKEDIFLYDRVSPIALNEEGSLMTFAGETFYTKEDWDKLTNLWLEWNQRLA